MTSGAEGLFARDPTARSLAIELGVVAEGRASVRLQLTESMVNGHGLAHGGYVFLLADAAFAYASNTHGPAAVAQAAQITFLRPARAGDVLCARATQRSRVGRHGVYDVTVSRDDGAVVAEFRGHSVFLPGPATPADEGGPDAD